MHLLITNYLLSANLIVLDIMIIKKVNGVKIIVVFMMSESGDMFRKII